MKVKIQQEILFQKSIYGRLVLPVSCDIYSYGFHNPNITFFFLLDLNSTPPPFLSTVLEFTL